VTLVDAECSLTPRSYVYYTQIMQAEALSAAYRLWRRNWAGLGKEYTAGALVWQVGTSRRIIVPDFSLFDFPVGQRLLARDLLVNSRLFSPSEACIFRDRA
jgi:hypothetical protein